MTVPVPIDYMMLMSVKPEKLGEAVQDHMKHKWIPLGGAIYAGGSFVQTMVKYEE